MTFGSGNSNDGDLHTNLKVMMSSDLRQSAIDTTSLGQMGVTIGGFRQMGVVVPGVKTEPICGASTPMLHS